MIWYKVVCDYMSTRTARRAWECEENACTHDDRTIEAGTEYLRVAPSSYPGEWTYHLDCGFAFYDARPAPERPGAHNGYQRTHQAGDWIDGCGRGCVVIDPYAE